MFNLVKQCKATRVSESVAAGTDDVNSSSVDMCGFSSVTFVVAMGAIGSGAVTSAKVQQSSDDGDADAFSDLTGTGVTIADTDDEGLVLIEVNEPLKRYVRCVVDRGTANAEVDSIVALQSRAGVEPVTHDATTVIDSEWHHAPSEGTA